jgi:uncharacterized membrane protein
MSEGPRKTKYDTNPLPSVEEVTGGVDPEGPTRPMDPDSAPQQPPYVTDPTVSRTTGWQQGDTGPYATTPGAPSQGYMPPRYVEPPQMPAPLSAGAFTSPSGPGSRSSLVTQFGLTPNFAAMACYLPFIGIVPSLLLMLTEPNESVFVRFHSKQATFAHAAFWAVTFAFSIARAAMPWPIGVALLLPELLFFVATIAAFVYLMVKAYAWKMVKIPVIGDQVE